MRWVTLLFAIASGLLLLLVGREMGQIRAGAWAAVLYLCSPMLGHSGRRIAAEVPLVALALAGVWLFLCSVRNGSKRQALIAGGFFGLGFLCKLWLVLPPLAGALAAALWSGHPRGERTRSARGADKRGHALTAGALAGFIAVGSLQILLCSILTPKAVPHWLRVYFGFSLADRVAGEGFAAYWHRPWSFYPLAIGRSLSLWLPALAVGFVTLAEQVRRGGAAGEERGTAPQVLTVWLLPLLPMSLVAVKSGGYIEPLLPALFLIGGLGLDRLFSKPTEARAATPEVHTGCQRRGALTPILLAALLATGFCLASHLSFVRGTLQPSMHSLVPAALHVLWIIGLAALGILGVRGRIAHHFLWACLAASLLAGVYRNVQIVRLRDHVTGYRQVAERLAAGLRDVSPQEPCFYAPEWPSMSCYTFRSGRYWESPYVPADPAGVLAALRCDRPWFFVVDVPGQDLYGGLPDAATRAAIQREGYALSHAVNDAAPRAVIYVNAALRAALADSMASERP